MNKFGIQIGNITIYYYSILILLGVIIGLYLALKEADNVVYKLSFPGKSGTFALTSDIKSLTSNTTASGGIKYITEVSFTNGVLTLESKYLHLK